LLPRCLAFSCRQFARQAPAPLAHSLACARPCVPHFIVNIYHNYTIRQRVIAPPLPFSFFGAFMKPFYFFAGAERPQGVRHFLSSAGSEAQPPRFFLLISLLFLFLFSFFPLFLFLLFLLGLYFAACRRQLIFFPAQPGLCIVSPKTNQAELFFS
jgi:hypothetical protein